jgi:hypothetical protein
MSLFTLGFDVSFFLYFLSLFFFVACGGLVSDLEYKRCFVGVLFIVRFSPCPFPLGVMVPSWIVLRGAALRQSSARGVCVCVCVCGLRLKGGEL